MSEPAIEARGLEKRFGPAVALAGLDLEVPRGSSLAVLGPNGAGKSTLLRLMAGLAHPTAGSLRMAGQPAHHRRARARVGLIAHETFLYPELTARENLIFAARLHDVRDPGARASELLLDADLGDVGDRAAGGFSRGMAQRLAIARALVHDPEVVLLDEPFTGLDRRACERLALRLEALRGGVRTLVLVTHDVDQAIRLADAAIVLARGRVAHVEIGAAGLDAAALEAATVAAGDASP